MPVHRRKKDTTVNTRAQRQSRPPQRCLIRGIPPAFARVGPRGHSRGIGGRDARGT